MNELIRHIEFLLVTNDCVVIPGVGAVLAHAMPSHFDEVSFRFVPPTRTFSFNVSLSHNDGLLIGSVARAKSISFEAARDFVVGEVEAMHRVLASEGQLNLGLVGSLFMTAESTLSFTPGPTSELSPSCFWLPPVNVVTVSDLAKRRENIHRIDAEIRSGNNLRSYVYRTARVAASFALLIALAFVLTTPIQIDQAQYASLGIENFKSAVSESETSLLRLPGTATSAVTLYIHTHDDACEVVDTAARAAYVRDLHNIDVLNSAGPRFDENDDYCLIVASLVSQSEADKFIASTKYPHQLGILAKDGRYRVYAATGSTQDQAREAAAQIADHYSGVWVCRR